MRATVFFLLCMLPFWLFGQQETYVINPSENCDVDLLKKGLSMCELDRYRKPETRVQLVFTDGTTVALFSEKELIDAGIEYDASVINRTPYVLSNYFRLTSEGYILEEIKHVTKEELAKEQWGDKDE